MQRSGDSGKPGICRASPGSQLPHPEGDGRTRGGRGGGWRSKGEEGGWASQGAPYCLNQEGTLG